MAVSIEFSNPQRSHMPEITTLRPSRGTLALTSQMGDGCDAHVRPLHWSGSAAHAGLPPAQVCPLGGLSLLLSRAMFRTARFVHDSEALLLCSRLC